MSGSRLNPAERQLAEQHLGDRLAALVDGELGHDTRERVLAHLATCAKCKAEADAQRRLKTFFAEVAPPPPSESFLARLQGLSESGGPGGPGEGDPFGRPLADGVFGVRDDGGFGLRADTFSYAPSGGRGGMLPGGDRAGGFRIHQVGRGAAERAAASRGRRFAFAAAGAVSVAAIALGGVSTGVPADASDARGRTNASPTRAQGGATAADTTRRRGGAQSTGTQEAGKLPAVVAAPEVSAPSVPGPAGQRQLPLASPILNRASLLPPLIRPVAATVPYSPLPPIAEHTAEPGETSGPGEAPLPSPSPSAGLSLRAR
ncbi:zf-HC2 domain-containing protein [Streptomyces sp. TRM66268-LWL]|uniref:Zf-HC2 domain-containing protein n=1 Tax=Streptomyces polyasparticus TaxID=2767826 RepID=A0ABR7S9T3_9ACTN|nr:zf-HC2 domain-containing protein [Streptomyces polyasparticus]MBC9711098.1 zf-HC2 domain-containing protein [Streptomyces polyasparticus]